VAVKKAAKTVRSKTAAKKTPAAKAAASGLPDPRFDPVLAPFEGKPGVSLMGSKSGALRSLMGFGKAFAMSSHGRFVLKLAEERAAKLIDDGFAVAFEHGPGRPMKGWVHVTSDGADWLALADEAYRLASASAPTRKAKR
jgi:hypothetical protein